MKKDELKKEKWKKRCGMKPLTNHLVSNGKSMILAYDQGLEHGPVDFNLNNVDPDFIIDLAVHGKFNGIVLQKGIAEKYYVNHKHTVPLILKLNGKTRLTGNEPYAPLTCSVKKAVELGADAVGFTVYVGSKEEERIFSDFRKVQEEAHDFGISVMAWMYPRGSSIKDETSVDILAYAARIGLELGADILKMKFNPDVSGYKWVVKSAGRVPVVCSGESKMPEPEFLDKAKLVMKSGAAGMCVGRNIWQSRNPLAAADKLRKIIFG